MRIDEQPVSHDHLAPSRDRRKAIRTSRLRLESQADIYQDTANFSTSVCRVIKETSHLQRVYGYNHSGLRFPDQQGITLVVTLPVFTMDLGNQSRMGASVWRKPSEKRGRREGVLLVHDKRLRGEQRRFINAVSQPC